MMTAAITKEEFRRALPELGLWPRPADVDEFFESFDTDQGGNISFRELNASLRRSRLDAKPGRPRPLKDHARELPEVADLCALRRELYKELRAEGLRDDILSGLHLGGAEEEAGVP